MGCCGQKRAEIAASLYPAATVAATNSGEVVTLRYIAAAPILVRGALTGRHYRFAPANAVQEVDARDAGVLLGTRLFRREW